MSPTLMDGDRVLSNQAGELARGDIVVIRYPQNPNYLAVARIVALPGETVRMDESGQLYLNGRPLNEPYARPGKDGNQQIIPEQTMGAREYWVLGDNRAGAQDSREWGPVAAEAICGQVVWRYWPLTRVGPVK